MRTLAPLPCLENQKLDRASLIELCEKAIISYPLWKDARTHRALKEVGHAWALLKSDVPYVANVFCDRLSGEDCIEIRFYMDAPAMRLEDRKEICIIPALSRLIQAQGSDWWAAGITYFAPPYDALANYSNATAASHSPPTLDAVRVEQNTED